MRILVTGGRGLPMSCEAVLKLTGLEPEVVVHGACPTGADAAAGRWASSIGAREERWPAEWGKYGRAAGPIRNQAMVDSRPDLIIALPGGRGTADCVRRARAAGLRIMEIG